jgi:glyoxylase-like metal-dependent hydrolase (beta-lactamase superfamily II)
MLFRQLFDGKSSTWTYLLADEKTREAVIIDSVFEQVTRDAALIDELGLSLLFSLETHVHADHVTAAWLLKERFATKIVAAAAAGAEGVDMAVKDGDVVTVPDALGQKWLTHGWAKDVDGKFPTGRRIVRGAKVQPDDATHGVEN